LKWKELFEIKTGIVLMPKPDKDITKKENCTSIPNYRSITMMIRDEKFQHKMSK
jgi:hypothetical protein